jgi:transcriptional regulator with XRE-family HTH domain
MTPGKKTRVRLKAYDKRALDPSASEMAKSAKGASAKQTDIQQIQIEGVDYILVRAEKYQELLHELDSIDTALEVQQTRADASERVAETLLSGRYTPEQMNMIFGAGSFGQRLQVLRQVHNLNQQELAEVADVSQATISKLENDRVENPAFEEVHKVLTGLQIPDAAAFEIFSGHRASSGRSRLARKSDIQPAEHAESYEPKKQTS